MNEITLESLARRVETLERALRIRPPVANKSDWQRAVGMFAGSEFMRQVDQEGRKIREAERDQARTEQTDS